MRARGVRERATQAGPSCSRGGRAGKRSAGARGVRSEALTSGPAARRVWGSERAGPREESGPRGAGPSERGRSGLGLAGKEKGRAGWAQGKETGQAKGENWAGVLGKGWKAGYCYGFPFSILILKQTHKLEFKCEFEFKPQSLN